MIAGETSLTIIQFFNTQFWNMRLAFLSFIYLQNRKIQNERYEVFSFLSYTSSVQITSRSVSTSI